MNIFVRSFWITFGLSRQECIDELKSLYGNEAPSYSTVKNWFKEFNRGRRSLKDKFREGHPETVREYLYRT